MVIGSSGMVLIQTASTHFELLKLIDKFPVWDFKKLSANTLGNEFWYQCFCMRSGLSFLFFQISPQNNQQVAYLLDLLCTAVSGPVAPYYNDKIYQLLI